MVAKEVCSTLILVLEEALLLQLTKDTLEVPVITRPDRHECRVTFRFLNQEFWEKRNHSKNWIIGRLLSSFITPEMMPTRSSWIRTPDGIPTGPITGFCRSQMGWRGVPLGSDPI